MKKLSSTEIAGRKIKIQYKDIEEWGLCNIDTLTITLSKKCLKNKKLHQDVLTHEVIHMALELGGVAYMESNDEEAYVRCIEGLILPWVMKNKKNK